MNLKTHRLLSAVLLVTFFGTAFAQDVVTAPFDPDSGNITIRCGILIDGIGDQPRTIQTVVISDGRIASVSSDSGDVDLDLSGYTCMPGFIDTHTHIAEQISADDLSFYYRASAEEIWEESRVNAALTLAAGFTTARNVGSYVGWSARDIRDRINRGELVGPRMQIAGYYLTIPGGGGDLVVPGYDEADIPARVRTGIARGPEQFRRKAEAAVAGGADVLKVIASGAVLAPGSEPGSPEMTPDEIRAVVEVAHAAGVKVTAHAHGTQSIKDAIRAGVDSVEHASLADDEAIALALEKKVAFSMDVYNGSYIATYGREQGWPDEFIRKNDDTTEAQRQVFTKAYEAGVTISFGTDSGVYPHGENAKQFVIMVRRGMKPMDAIKSATSVAAQVIGWEEDVGSIAPGYYGDLIAVRGDPLSDVSVLQDMKVVVKGGLVFRHGY